MTRQMFVKLRKHRKTENVQISVCPDWVFLIYICCWCVCLSVSHLINISIHISRRPKMLPRTSRRAKTNKTTVRCLFSLSRQHINCLLFTKTKISFRHLWPTRTRDGRGDMHAYTMLSRPDDGDVDVDVDQNTLAVSPTFAQ